jgi:hypothetical protein
MASAYFVGSDVRVTAIFTVDDVATNPTAVYADAYLPDGTVVTYTYGVSANLTRPSTGNYWLVIDCTQSGKWRIAWRSTGTAKAATSTSFEVNPLPLP